MDLFLLSWTSDTGQPQKITGDGQNILVTTSSAIKEIDPTGAQVWSQDIAVSGNGSAVKAGKYVFVGTANDARALNKADGSTKWTKTDVLGAAQPVKYVFVKGTCVIFSNSEKAIVLDRETGNNLTAVQDAPTVSEPSVFGGYYLAGTSTGVTAYKGFMFDFDGTINPDADTFEGEESSYSDQFGLMLASFAAIAAGGGLVGKV